MINDPHRTDEVTLEQQVKLLSEKLAEAQKLTALGELVGTTAHEFNNVLTTVINYAKLGLRHRDDATRDKALTKILAAGERAARITQSVLGMARNRSQGMEPTDLAELIQETMLVLEREMRKYRIQIDYQIQPSAPPAMVNGNQIQQVLLNLLINARQAMPQGGTITIRLQTDSSSDMVQLSVRDSGKGMPPEVMHRIFDPFYSTKDGPDATGKGGAGLGLSACRDIVDAHQGRLKVQSTVGKGACFTILLPVAESPNYPNAAAS